MSRWAGLQRRCDNPSNQIPLLTGLESLEQILVQVRLWARVEFGSSQTPRWVAWRISGIESWRSRQSSWEELWAKTHAVTVNTGYVLHFSIHAHFYLYLHLPLLSSKMYIYYFHVLFFSIFGCIIWTLNPWNVCTIPHWMHFTLSCRCHRCMWHPLHFLEWRVHLRFLLVPRRGFVKNCSCPSSLVLG